MGRCGTIATYFLYTEKAHLLMNKTVIYYATGNRYKFLFSKNYIEKALSDVEVRHLAVDFPERQTHDQEAIAHEKAALAYAQCKAPVLADDAGMYMDAYTNFPGFMAKFVYESLGVKGLLTLAQDNNKASLKIFLAYCNGDEKQTFIGEQHGVLQAPESAIPADTGQPFNYLLVPSGAQKAFALLSEEEKARVGSFRMFALHAFVTWYTDKQTEAS